MPSQSFIPALGHDWLTPCYDVLIRLTLPEKRFKLALIRAAALAEDHRVLDVGCGTGTLLRLAGELHSRAQLVGIDPDPHIIERARTKLRHFGGRVTLEQASATALPFVPESFDRALSTLTFHHLPRESKAEAMREIHRVLRPLGEFHLGDFGQPDTTLMHLVSALTERIGGEYPRENYGGLLPSMLRDAGFSSVAETARFSTPFGVLRSLRAVKR